MAQPTSSAAIALPAQAESSPLVESRLFTADLSHLQGGRCAACRAFMFPARCGCPDCGWPEVDPVALAGTGRIWTYTVLHIRPPGYAGPCPLVLAIVELDDGVRVTTVVTCADAAQVEIGDPVRFELIDVGAEGTPLWTFAHRKQ